jgi:hypothetical protein
MGLSDQAERAVANFLQTIEPLLPGYNASTLNILALRTSDTWTLLKAQMLLASTPTPESRTFQSEHILAAVFPVATLGMDIPTIIRKLAAGSIELPIGELILPRTMGIGHLATFSSFEPEGLRQQRRVNALHLLGDAYDSSVDRLSLDWEVKAAQTPYDGLDELSSEFRIGPLGNSASVDILATNAAEIMFDSIIEEETAKVGVYLAEGLDIADASVGYRVFNQGAIVSRGLVKGGAIDWTAKTGVHVGRLSLPVSAGALVQCFANYKGLTQHQYWVVDPRTTQNHRRAIYETFDSSQVVLEGFLLRSAQSGNPAGDFEAAVAWWLWMVGFNVMHLGHNAKLRDAPDIIAIAPAGHVAVIECTTGLLKAQSKLQQLLARTAAVRRSLDVSGHSHVRILPIMVTAKARAEIEADLSDAEKLGVLVLTVENLTNAVKETLLLPNPDALFVQAEQTVEAAKTKHSSHSQIENI